MLVILKNILGFVPPAKVCQPDAVRRAGESSVKLSNIARSLKEDMALIKTEDRLSRNLDASGLESHLSERLAAMGSRGVENDAGPGYQ